jgi:L-serine dehydratase
MFISTLELFKIGIGPSSSHTMGPMAAANDFRRRIADVALDTAGDDVRVRCTLKGSLAFTGRGHATDRAVMLGLHGYTPQGLAREDVNALVDALWQRDHITVNAAQLRFRPDEDIVFDRGAPLPEHPNGMIYMLSNASGETLLGETYFSIGGGFINTLAEISSLSAPLRLDAADGFPYGFDSADSMLQMAQDSGLTLPKMKRQNELQRMSDTALNEGLDAIWNAMRICIGKGLTADGTLPGGLNIRRRARALYQQLQEQPRTAEMNDWLCAYAMAVNEENAAGHMVVTAPTNGAAGVIPAVLYYFVKHQGGDRAQIRDFLLVAGAIGGIIKHRSSISGAEVGCQGEVGSAAAMAAAGLCAVRGGSIRQIENAAEIALEHHLGMTCDPVKGLVQVPCIERNGFGAIKAYTAASLALRGNGEHFMSLDNCIAAMKQTGLEMSEKYKETALGGLAVSITEC